MGSLGIKYFSISSSATIKLQVGFTTGTWMYMTNSVASRLFPGLSLRGYISERLSIRVRTLGFPIYKVFTGRK